MYLSNMHLISLFVTITIVFAIGLYSARRVNSAEAFTLGGRSAGAAIVSGTIAGTVIGGAATVGTAQMAFAIGLSAWWFTLGAGIGFVIMGIFYAGPLRKSGLETISQYLVLHYGKTVGPLTSIIAAAGMFFSIVASSLSGIHLISVVFDLAVWQAAAVILVLVIGYILLGGLQGAGLSGLLKVGILYITLLVAGSSAFSSLRELPVLSEAFPDYPWFSLFANGVEGALLNLFSLITGIICTQTYVQAIYSARDARTASIGAFTAALVTIPIGLPSVAVGMFMHVYHPSIVPINALPMYMLHYLPAWLGGIGIAGLLLSIVGSIAGMMLGFGTMIARDIFHELVGITDSRKLLLFNRGTITLVTLLAMTTAMGKLQSQVLDWNYLSMALRGAGIFLPLTLAIFWPGKLTAGWAITSAIVSTLVAVICHWLVFLKTNPLFGGLAASAITILLGILISRFEGRNGNILGHHTWLVRLLRQL